MRKDVAVMLAEAARGGITHQAVEAEVVRRYLSHHSLDALPGSRLEMLLETTEPAPQLTLPENFLHTTDDLVNLFEMLVPEADAKRFGAYYTPAVVTHFMAKRLLLRLTSAGINLRDARILDPAVGCGALLIAVCAELAAVTGETFAQVSNRLTGTDLAADSINRSFLLFEAISLSRGDATIPGPHLRVQDGLSIKGQYEGIIANPPYVRFQVLDVETRKVLEATWQTCSRGNFNLYYPFIEASHSLLVPNGAAVFITPNAFLASASGEPLREFLAQKQYLASVLDFDEHKVFEVSTYTCISEYVQGTNDAIAYRKSEGVTELRDATLLNYPGSAKEYDYANLGSWHFIDPSDETVVAQNAANPIPMNEVFQVRYSLATLRDKLYSFTPVDEDANHYHLKDAEGRIWPIEKAATRPCVKVSDVFSQDELAANSMRIIYPYTVTNASASIIPESVMEQDFPLTLAYLNSIREELAKRDKGKKTYATWYAYGRTQGLIPVREKLLSPLYAKKGRFLLESDGSLVLNGVMLVHLPSSPLTLAEAWEHLASDEVSRYMLATSKKLEGGFASYQRPDLLRVRFPQP